MATITLEYDARNSTMKKALDLFLSLGAKVVSPKKKEAVSAKSGELTEVELSMQEAREGKVNQYESVEDMFQKLGI